ncbi:MAG: hypothetical protein U0174_09020 [Polyangiaceae bacterium]
MSLPSLASGSRVLLIVAMEAEARSLIADLGLVRDERFGDPRLPFAHYRGSVHGLDLLLSLSGKDARFEVDSIGTEPAALSAYVSATAFEPQLCINAGTAGGFIERGGKIGDVYLSEGTFRYHDRRISIPGFDAYGVGSFPTADVRALARKLDLKSGVVTTGSSLDLADCDAHAMERFGAHAKEMEAAAIGWVMHTLGIPFFAVKAITDLVDGPNPSHEEFLANLDTASKRLHAAVLAVLGELGGEPS